MARSASRRSDRLAREVHDARRAAHRRGHDLLAEKKSRPGGQFNPCLGPEADRRAIDDHHFALAQFKHEI